MRCTFLILVTVCVGACSVLPRPDAAPVRIFILDLPPAGDVRPALQGKVLTVAMPDARPGYDTPRLAYMKRDYALDYYASSQWADAPARMLQPLLVHALEATGKYRAVLLAPAPVNGDLRLDTEVVRLEQVFSTSPSRVHFALRAQLIDMRHGLVLGTRVFKVEVPAPSEDAYGGVRAANQAVAELLHDLAVYCLTLSDQ